MPASLRFAHFEVLTRSDGSPHMLGHGAMGSTFKALDQNLLSLAVVKVPSVELLANPAARQRFLQEAQMMARLRHPHVASVFYYGDSVSGPFYAMEFCDGPSLHDYIDHHGPLEPEDTLRVALQVAAAIQALDTHELVHRDLKPSNIILTTDSAGGAHAKVIDFGVAKEGLPTDTGGLTLGGFIGTPAFASPEQLLEASHLDSRSDLYSLGAVMWFCLTGQPPFQGSQFEVMFHHVNTEPLWNELPPMSAASLGVMKRLLAKSAEERYSSPAALIQVLQKILGIAAPISNGMQLRTSIYEKDKAGLSGFETLQSLASDDFGKVSKACDVLTGKIVSMRELPAEFSQKQGLVLRMQRLAAILRPLDHPRWQRIWHFEHSGAECRLATELIEGPTLLQLLKVHQHLSLSYALPLLTQLVEAMDAAASEGLTAVETAIERLPIAVDDWGLLKEKEQATLLRKPFAEWPAWSVKICPLRLSNSIQDYVLPSDSQAALAITRISTDFIQLCYRLLTGQGRSASAYVPSPLLSADSNAFFERHFSTQRSSTPQTCDTLLRHLCRAEGVAVPELPEDQNWDPFATRVVTRQRTIGRTKKQVRPVFTQSGTSSPDAATIAVPRPATSVSVDANAATIITRAPSSPVLFDTPTILDQKHAKVASDASQLKTDDRLRVEQEWISRERESIEQAKKDAARYELARAQQLADEQARLAEQKKQIEQQQAQLDDKRREQERLEQEIQLRAQLEFQKLQEEARSRESDLQRQRQAVEQALKEREREFEEREKARLKELQSLKEEVDHLEDIVEQEYLTVRKIEDDQVRRFEEAAIEEEKQLEQLAANEAKLAEIEQRNVVPPQVTVNEPAPLSTPSPAPPLLASATAQPVQQAAVVTPPLPLPAVKEASAESARKAQSQDKKSAFSIILLVGLFAFLLLIGGGYFVIKSAFGSKLTPFLQSFTESAESKARRAAKESQQWKSLLALCLQQEPALKQAGEASEADIKSLYDDAAAAIHALLADQNSWPALSDPARNEWITEIHSISQWQTIPIAELMLAKLRIPVTAQNNTIEQGVEDYLRAIQSDKGHIAQLETEAAIIAPKLDAVLSTGYEPHHDAWLNQLEANLVNGEARSAALIRSQLHISKALHQGDIKHAIATLIETGKQNQDAASSLKALSSLMVKQLSALSIAELQNYKAGLTEIAEQTKIADAWLLLAKLETTVEDRKALLSKADQMGSLSARALIGKETFDSGVKSNNSNAINEGLGKLREAASSNSDHDRLLLADALSTSQGINQEPEQGIKNATEALQISEELLRHDKGAYAAYVAGKASLQLGHLQGDADAYLNAIDYLQQSISEPKPGVYFLIYKASNNPVIRTKQNDAVAALQKGVEAMDADCLYELGLWYQIGRPPIKADAERSYELMQKAAKLGHESAKNWLKQQTAAPQL